MCEARSDGREPNGAREDGRKPKGTREAARPGGRGAHELGHAAGRARAASVARVSDHPTSEFVRPAHRRCGTGRPVRRLLRGRAQDVDGGPRFAGGAGRSDHRDVPGEGDLRRRRVPGRQGPRVGRPVARAGRAVQAGLPARAPGSGAGTRRRHVRGDDFHRHRIEVRAIVITGGIGTFTPRPLPTGGSTSGRGLVHFVPDPAAYAGQHVVVVGGGDSAVDWALMLEPIAKR